MSSTIALFDAAMCLSGYAGTLALLLTGLGFRDILLCVLAMLYICRNHCRNQTNRVFLRVEIRSLSHTLRKGTGNNMGFVATVVQRLRLHLYLQVA